MDAQHTGPGDAGRSLDYIDINSTKGRTMLRYTLSLLLLLAVDSHLTATAAHQRDDNKEPSHAIVTFGDNDTNVLAWNVLGLRLAETDGTTVRSVNKKTGSRYRGAMKIEAIRADGPANKAGLRDGDLLLGIHGWQTITEKDVRGILTLKNEYTPLDPTKVKYFILRDGKTLYGFLVPTEPLTGQRTKR